MTATSTKPKVLRRKPVYYDTRGRAVIRCPTCYVAMPVEPDKDGFKMPHHGSLAGSCKGSNRPVEVL